MAESDPKVRPDTPAAAPDSSSPVAPADPAAGSPAPDPEPPVEPAAPREAILFVPGLSGAGGSDQSAKGVAGRLAAAMDRKARTPSAKFRAGEVREKEFGLRLGRVNVYDAVVCTALRRRQGATVRPPPWT